MVTFTERINIAIDMSGLTIMQISQQSHIPRSKIYQLQKGESLRMWSDNLKVLCQTLGVSADWLLGIKGGKFYETTND